MRLQILNLNYCSIWFNTFTFYVSYEKFISKKLSRYGGVSKIRSISGFTSIIFANCTISFRAIKIIKLIATFHSKPYFLPSINIIAARIFIQTSFTFIATVPFCCMHLNTFSFAGCLYYANNFWREQPKTKICAMKWMKYCKINKQLRGDHCTRSFQSHYLNFDEQILYIK